MNLYLDLTKKISLNLIVLGVFFLISCSEDLSVSSEEPDQEKNQASLSSALLSRGDEVPEINILVPKEASQMESPVLFTIDTDFIKLKSEGVVKDGEGHLHYMVNVDCVEPGNRIPEDESHIHSGDGANSVLLDLSPGDYEVCVQVGDGFHIATNIKKIVRLEVI